ncbi:hypothetical protein ABKN59_008812 [Abortiporus biennis]
MSLERSESLADLRSLVSYEMFWRDHQIPAWTIIDATRISDGLGEFVDFLTQIIEGVQYMHEQNVAHRDIMVTWFAPTDIWYLGHMMQRFAKRFKNIGFLQPLIHDMMQNEPSKRPTIHEVAGSWDTIRRSLSSWRLRLRRVDRGETIIEYVAESARHIFRIGRYIAQGYNAIPTMSEDYAKL